MVRRRRGEVFFTNSGTEANEAAFKITRLTGRTKIIADRGRVPRAHRWARWRSPTIPKYREPFEPLPGEVIFVPYGDADALAAAVDDDDRRGRAGADPGRERHRRAADRLPAQAREICDAHGALLWIDEVQTGIGRTGDWLVHSSQGVQADIVTLAKGLGNGFPIGACVANGAAARPARSGQHGSTFGGNPVAAIAGLAVHRRDRARRAARPRNGHGRAPRDAVEALPTPAGRRRPRPRTAAGRRADRAGRRGGGRRRAGRRVHRSTRRGPTSSGSRRR